MNDTNFLLSLLSIALAIIGYFLKKILDTTENLSNKLDELWKDLHDMKPRLNFLWENRKRENSC